MLDPNTMADDVVAHLLAVEPAGNPAKMKTYWLAACTAICERITMDAQVVVAGVSGVTGGGSESGPGTGTIT